MIPPIRFDILWLLVVLMFGTACWLALDSPCMEWPGGQSCDLKLEFLKPF